MDLDPLGPEMWNDSARREGQRVSRTAPVCEDCWWLREHRTPVRIIPPEAKVCCWCGAATRSGIYLRVAPDQQLFKAWEPE